MKRKILKQLIKQIISEHQKLKLIEVAAVSNKQRGLFNIVVNYKKDNTIKVSSAIKKIADGISLKDAKKIAYTKGELPDSTTDNED